MTIPTTHGVSQMKRHSDFYFRDGNVSFHVENTVFRLHRHFFERESAYFRERLSPPTDGGKSGNGSVENPFMIHDVKSDEFAQLVWVWYNPQYTYAKQSKEQWLTILGLAVRWHFGGIKQLAIRQLEKLDLPPIEKISTYKRFDVDHKLLLPSYISLCKRDSLPSPDEGKVLGMETVLQLAASRERALVRASASGCASPTSPTVPNEILEPIVAELFNLGTNSSANNSTNTETVPAKQPHLNKKGEPQAHDRKVTESPPNTHTKPGERDNVANGANPNQRKHR